MERPEAELLLVQEGLVLRAIFMTASHFGCVKMDLRAGMNMVPAE